MIYSKDEIVAKAERFADDKERRDCAYWSGLKHGYIAGMEESQNSGKPDVMRSLPPTEDKIKEALLLGYVVGRCSTADIDENVLWENYKKHILKFNSDTQNEAAMPL